MISVEALCADARSWLGVPFLHQGRSRLGVDCIGLPEAILRARGLLPDGYSAPTNYARRPQAELEVGLAQWCQRAPAPAIGTLLAIRWPDFRYSSHVALLVGRTVIHAYNGVVCEHGYAGRWVRWTQSAWMLPGIAYE